MLKWIAQNDSRTGPLVRRTLSSPKWWRPYLTPAELTIYWFYHGKKYHQGIEHPGCRCVQIDLSDAAQCSAQGINMLQAARLRNR